VNERCLRFSKCVVPFEPVVTFVNIAETVYRFDISADNVTVTGESVTDSSSFSVVGGGNEFAARSLDTLEIISAVRIW